MSKKWSKLPRGVTQEDVNATMRAARDRRNFLGTLKTPRENKWGVLTHDGTNFTVNATGTNDFWVSYE